MSGCWSAFFVVIAGTLEHSTIVISPPGFREARSSLIWRGTMRATSVSFCARNSVTSHGVITPSGWVFASTTGTLRMHLVRM